MTAPPTADETSDTVPLPRYAHSIGVHPATALRWFRAGRIVGAWQPGPRCTVRVPTALLGHPPQ